mmetsp:Transcript_4794/g.7409  ORF Transcript_4794/g.7409 Transcript_4794/m.7409 type:complete len:151 (+) Transcript_4794:340-792(+)
MSHYLPIEHWSPRYDEEFFTVKITEKKSLNSQPNLPASLGGNTNHPAVYYCIEVYSKNKKHVCLRRYSHFKWLHEHFLASVRLPKKANGISEADLSLPPTTCPWQIHNEDFLQIRLEGLQDYLREALSLPGFAQEHFVQKFLELENFSVK